jgi:hypothetical protein
VALLSFAAAVAVPVILARRAELAPSALLSLPWQAHLAGAGVMAVEVAARAGRLLSLSHPLGVPLRPATAVLAQLAADAAGAVTPARSGSEPAKLLTLRRDGGGIGGVAAVAVGEMAFEVGGLLLVAGLFAVTLPDGARAAGAVLTYAGVVATGLVVLYHLAGRPGRAAPGWWRRWGLAPARWRRLVQAAGEFRRRVGGLRTLGARGAGAALGFTLLHQAAKAATVPALVAGAMAGGMLAAGPEAGAPPWARLVIVPFSLLYLGALLPPPGGGGGIEVAFAALLGDALPATRLPVLLLWWRAYSHYASAVAGGVVVGVLTMRRRTVGRGVAPR